MKIILGSKNNSKKEAVKLAFEKLNYSDLEIAQLEVNSYVSSKPINDEIVIGAHNRNQELLKYCLVNNAQFDLLISIEGGYEQIGNYYFIVTYASIVDSNKNEYIGKSCGLQITKDMYNWVKKGNSLNKVIEEILNTENNKKNNGITGYLTNGYYYRSYFDSEAVISAMQTMKNIDISYKKIDNKLKELINI